MPDWTIWSGAGARTARPPTTWGSGSTAWWTGWPRPTGTSLVFAHGHSLRVLAARWLGLPPTDGRHFRLDTATVSVLGHERESPVVLRWNC